jgi:ADP-heptose:LPS heptosyltransferase
VMRADPFPAFGHAADHLLRTVELEKPELPDLWSPDSDEVIVHPGSGSVKKIWPHFDALADRLPEAVILVPPSPSGRGQGEGLNVAPPRPSPGFTSGFALPGSRFARAASPGGRGENLLLTEVSQRLRRCRAYVGNDSGITHLAAYLGCPTIALFGPTDPRVWGPIGRRSRIIWKTKLEDIRVDEVVNAIHATDTRTRTDG